MDSPKRGDFFGLQAFGDEPLVPRHWVTSVNGAFILSDEEYKKRVSGQFSLARLAFQSLITFRIANIIRDLLILLKIRAVFNGDG